MNFRGTRLWRPKLPAILFHAGAATLIQIKGTGQISEHRRIVAEVPRLGDAEIPEAGRKPVQDGNKEPPMSISWAGTQFTKPEAWGCQP